MPVLRKARQLYEILIHVNEVIWHDENGGETWETSHQCCIVRKVIGKEVAIRGRFDFFLDSANKSKLLQIM